MLNSALRKYAVTIRVPLRFFNEVNNMSKSNNLIGQRFGKLTVIERAENNKQGKTMWKCVCDCGKVKLKPVSSYDLKKGKVTSCGCNYFISNKSRNKKHGMTNTRLYEIWSSVKQRCYNKKSMAYKYYGGRGIAVCDEWVNDFQAFYVWAMANGYRDDLTIDRIDNNKGYSPDNCRWATYKTQENNRTNNMIVEYKGQKYTVSQLSKILGISQPTLNWRIKHNWAENELDIPVNLNNSNIRRLKNGTK